MVSSYCTCFQKGKGKEDRPNCALKRSERRFCTQPARSLGRQVLELLSNQEPSFTGKQSKPSSVPYLILAGQTLCPAAPPLSTWKNCPLQTGSNLTYRVGYWCSALGNWQSPQHQEYLTWRVSPRKQIKRNMTGLVIRVKIWDILHNAKSYTQAAHML